MLNKKRGSTLITVIILTTVLLVLSLVLIDSALKGLILTQRHKNVDFAYYSGQSAIEKWFYKISEIADNQNIGEDYDEDIYEGNKDEYAQFILDKIKPELTNEIIDVMGVKDTVSFSSTDVECAEVKCYSLNNEGSVIEANDLVLTIGIEAKSTFSQPSTTYSTSNKTTYAQKKFRFKIPSNEFKLYGAIYTVGDLYVSGKTDLGALVSGFKSDIKGDAVVFGSFPSDILLPDQHYYGGIYAIHGAHLKIKGNAYSRSFIRTGPYRSGSPDESRIDIYRDAIAQGIHGFGNDTKIVVYRNAYTFDDVEINGEKSFIGINGSYFGLSRYVNEATTLKNHDAYSAIVNSAVLHNGLSEDSMKSRIAINGDVIVPGGTFKIATDTGEMLGQIEDASLAWFKDSISDLPYYKLYSWNSDPTDPESDVSKPDKYHEAVRTLYNSIIDSPAGRYLGGFMNLFQVWSSIPPSSPSSYDIETGGELEELMDIFISNVESAGDSKTPPIVPPNELYGCWFYELGANGRLYNSNAGGLVGDEIGWRGELAFINNGSYEIDNIYNESSGNLKYDGSTWTDIVGHYQNSVVERIDDGTSGDNIKNSLLNYTEVFGKRKYPTSATEKDWIIPNDVTLFGKILDKLVNRAVAYQSAGNAYSYLVPTHLSGIHNVKDLITYDFSTRPESVDVVNFDDDSEYYLLVNPNPNVDLVIDSPFNGIIYTAGKVILHNGADVRGSILSAGGGTYTRDVNYDGVDDVPNSIFAPPFDKLRLEIERTENNDAKALDRGEFAGVKINPDDTSKPGPKVDFYLGLSLDQDVIDMAKRTDSSAEYLNKAARENLLRKLSEHGINLFQIL
jgi:hypothetical protein